MQYKLQTRFNQNAREFLLPCSLAVPSARLLLKITVTTSTIRNKNSTSTEHEQEHTGYRMYYTWFHLLWRNSSQLPLSGIRGAMKASSILVDSSTAMHPTAYCVHAGMHAALPHLQKSGQKDVVIPRRILERHKPLEQCNSSCRRPDGAWGRDAR